VTRPFRRWLVLLAALVGAGLSIWLFGRVASWTTTEQALAMPFASYSTKPGGFLPLFRWVSPSSRWNSGPEAYERASPLTLPLADRETVFGSRWWVEAVQFSRLWPGKVDPEEYEDAVLTELGRFDQLWGNRSEVLARSTAQNGSALLEVCVVWRSGPEVRLVRYSLPQISREIGGPLETAQLQTSVAAVTLSHFEYERALMANWFSCQTDVLSFRPVCQ
jgi:hypothetical protein